MAPAVAAHTPAKRVRGRRCRTLPSTVRQYSAGAMRAVRAVEWRTRGVSSAGRAPALQAGGHRFDPGTLHLPMPDPVLRLSPQTLSQADRRVVAAWAADCAARVQGVFEAEAPGDRRPRDAIAR